MAVKLKEFLWVQGAPGEAVCLCREAHRRGERKVLQVSQYQGSALAEMDVVIRKLNQAREGRGAYPQGGKGSCPYLAHEMHMKQLEAVAKALRAA